MRSLFWVVLLVMAGCLAGDPATTTITITERMTHTVTAAPTGPSFTASVAGGPVWIYDSSFIAVRARITNEGGSGTNDVCMTTEEIASPPAESPTMSQLTGYYGPTADETTLAPACKRLSLVAGEATDIEFEVSFLPIGFYRLWVLNASQLVEVRAVPGFGEWIRTANFSAMVSPPESSESGGWEFRTVFENRLGRPLIVDLDFCTGISGGISCTGPENEMRVSSRENVTESLRRCCFDSGTYHVDLDVQAEDRQGSFWEVREMLWCCADFD